ncbi:MAG: hypothetical protein ACOYIK_04715 [Coriobacteriales bacterium]
MANGDILVDLERCTGCWTCAFACKFANGLSDEKWCINVRTLGSGEGIDKPAGTWPNLHMEWIPVWKTNCMRCSNVSYDYPEPYCVHDCPTKALFYGDVDDPETPAGAEAARLRADGRRLFTMSPYDGTRDGIHYVNRRS